VFDRQNFVCNHSKHRPIFSPPHTPPRYWDVGFATSQSDAEEKDTAQFVDDTYRTVMQGREPHTLPVNSKWMKKGDPRSPTKAKQQQFVNLASEETTDEDSCQLLASPQKLTHNNSNNTSSHSQSKKSPIKNNSVPSETRVSSPKVARAASRPKNNALASPMKWTKTKQKES
jgi:hypothetical protein